jgi:hypothetical protein
VKSRRGGSVWFLGKRLELLLAHSKQEGDETGQPVDLDGPPEKEEDLVQVRSERPPTPTGLRNRAPRVENSFPIECVPGVRVGGDAIEKELAPGPLGGSR